MAERDGAEAQFASFYERERQRAIGLAWLLTHDAAAAEDVVQDAFTAIYSRFDTVDDPTHYLRRAIINGIYQRSRRYGREQRHLTLARHGAPVSIDGPTGGLSDAIARLPLNQRTAIVLRYWADLDHHSIADAMGVRPSTVRSLCTRATAQLRKELSQ